MTDPEQQAREVLRPMPILLMHMPSATCVDFNDPEQRMAVRCRCGAVFHDRSADRVQEDWARHATAAAYTGPLAFPAAQPGEGTLSKSATVDAPTAFEEWWDACPHRTPSLIGYGYKKQLAFDAFYAALQLSTPHLPERLDREAVARIIDPPAWSERKRKSDEWRRTHTLKKADAILALLPAEPVQEMREGDRRTMCFDLTDREHDG